MRFNIIPYDSSYEQEVQSLIDRNFGLGYAKTKSLLGRNVLSWIIVKEANVIAFASTLIDGVSCLFDLIVVDSGYRNKGIGNQLFKHQYDNAIKSGSINSIKLYHWVKKDSLKPSCALKYGFKLVATHNEYWSNDSLQHNYECNECTTIPCVCTCEEYELLINSKS